MTIFWAAYGAVALVWGYFMARWVWSDDREIRPGSIPPKSVPWALSVWMLYGFLWPLFAVVFVIGWTYDHTPRIRSGIHRFFDRIFT